VGFRGGVQLNIARIWCGSGWRKPIRALSWTGVFAGAGLVSAGVRLVKEAARVAKPGQRDPSDGRVLDAQA